MADVAAPTGDGAYIAALDALWTSAVSRRMYMTGGIGSRYPRRDFRRRLRPAHNPEAYAETCASIANVMWYHRMVAPRRRRDDRCGAP